MPKVTFVKSARKKNPVAKKGESYYWWAFMQGGRGGPKRYSKTPPRASQLTQSDFLSALYSAQEAIEDINPASYASLPDFEADVQSIKDDLENLKSETE